MPPVTKLGDLSDWELSKHKAPKEIVPWDGMTPGYRTWVTRIHDYAQSINPNWRRVLDYVKVSKVMLNWQNLRPCKIDCLTLQELYALPYDLSTFLGSIMNNFMLHHLQSLAAGDERTGFERWRTAYLGP